jgi:DNA-directed RNA polymerase beta' subunit
MGFNVVPVAGHAIKVNPSIVVPFNMDFDGDTVNLHVPVSKGAIRDIR